MLEKDIEDWLTVKVEELGGMSLKFVSPGKPGVPDRIYIFPGGEVWFVELKQQLGRMSNIQKYWRELLINVGCNYLLIKGMKDAKEYVKDMRKKYQRKVG